MTDCMEVTWNGWFDGLWVTEHSNAFVIESDKACIIHRITVDGNHVWDVLMGYHLFNDKKNFFKVIFIWMMQNSSIVILEK